MVTDALFVVDLGLVLAWPAPVLLALGLAGPAAPAGDDAPGSVSVPPAEGWSDVQAERHSRAATPMTAQDRFKTARPPG